LLERGFTSRPLAWLTPSLGTVDALQPLNVDPPNMREEMCGPHRKRPAAEEEDASLGNGGENSPYAVFLSTLRTPTSKSAALLQDIKLGEPVPVFTGPAKKQPQSTQVAAADPKTVDPKAAKPGTKPVAPGAAKPAMAATAAVPWTSFGPGGLSNNPPSDLTTLLEQAGAADTVPLPRARPKIVIQRTSQAPPAQPAAAPAPASAAPKTTPKANPTPANAQKK